MLERCVCLYLKLDNHLVPSNWSFSPTPPPLAAFPFPKMSQSTFRVLFAAILASGAFATPLNPNATRTGDAKAAVPVSTPAYPAPWDPKIIEGLATIADPPMYSKAKSGAKVSSRAVLPTSTIDAATIQSYLPYTHLAASSYCASSIIQNWSCGQHCTALPGMQIVATGGNNEDVPDWYVGYLPSLASAVVVHQGTTPSAIESDLIHSGFVDAHDSAAPAILAAVKKIISTNGVKKITCIGHSLGGAIAILDVLSLQATLGNSCTYKVVTFGQPRVGNQAFADYVDAHLSDNSRITHNEDIVPIVPGRFLGFVHSSGEKHIDPSAVWWACSGQDNEADPECSTGEVSNILDGNTSDHTGPYVNGIVMGC
ncbi:hypothetical protein FRB95_002000 [Tulasnella sp. JGI-2019a]|nr:hypothetical protein FRB95_002000 [Tulasnella sp. JGI-2019a]